MWAIHFCRYSISGVDNDVPTSSPRRFSMALEVGRPTSKPRESASVRCLYFDFYRWILFSLYTIKMEISKILIATIVAATLISQTDSASLHSKPRTLQMRVTGEIPQKTANTMQRVWISYLVRFPRWSHYSQLKVIKLILTEIAILEMYSTYLSFVSVNRNNASLVVYSRGNARGDKLCF